MENHRPLSLHVATGALEKEGYQRIGVGLFIVDLNNGKIWTNTELHDKPISKRRKGQVSFPMETRKVGETIKGNILGALEEFRPLQSNEELVWIKNISYKGKYELVPNNAVDIVMLGLRNKQPETDNSLEHPIIYEDRALEIIMRKLRVATALLSVDRGMYVEVKHKGWLDIDELLKHPKILRPGTEQFLKLAQDEEWIKDFINSVNSVPSYMLEKCDNRFDFQRFWLERDTFPDMNTEM